VIGVGIVLWRRADVGDVKILGIRGWGFGISATGAPSANPQSLPSNP
jgi:hypothetical protein